MTKEFEQSIRDLRAQANIAKWEPGIPIHSILAQGSGWSTMCSILAGNRFRCEMCKTEQQIHEGDCENPKCSAKIVIKINRFMWHEELRRREKHMREDEYRRTNGAA